MNSIKKPAIDDDNIISAHFLVSDSVLKVNLVQHPHPCGLLDKNGKSLGEGGDVWGVELFFSGADG